MKKIYIADKTIREIAAKQDVQLSFKEKLEMAKILDAVGIDTIELPCVSSDKSDALLFKTIAASVKNSAVSVRTGFEADGVEAAYQAVKNAVKPCLTVALPVSSVQMEYICHKKAAPMLESVKELVALAKSKGVAVEFSACDATRSESDYLYNVIKTAVEAGADIITVCDDAGIMAPDEFSAFISDIYKYVPEMSKVRLGVEISDAINMSTASAFEAFKCGACEIKTGMVGTSGALLDKIVALIKVKGDDYGFMSDINTTQVSSAASRLEWLVNSSRSEMSPFDSGVNEFSSGITLEASDDITAVINAVKLIGYDLSADDNAKVYEAFLRVAEKKSFVSAKELDAIVASVAMQVPSTYHIVSYVINSGNIINATANICIEKDSKKLNGVAVGDGPIDAAFLAIEQITGHHYELDDFQIQAVTEGREAMGSSLVRLRSDSGKLYSGNGISTDVIGASIRAYISALNKIAYEEN